MKGCNGGCNYEAVKERDLSEKKRIIWKIIEVSSEMPSVC